MREQDKLIEPVSITQAMGPSEFGYQIAGILDQGLTDVFLNQHIEQLKTLSLQRKLQLIREDATIDEVKNILAEVDSRPANQNQDAILSPKEVKESITKYYQEGGEETFSTGWPTLDQYFNISKDQLTTVTGAPSSGKSEFLDALVVQMAEKHNWKTMFFSPENYPVNRHVRKLIEKYTHQPFFEGKTSRLVESNLNEAIEWVNYYFRFLYIEAENRTLDFVLSKITDVDIAVLDPWNEFSHSRPDSMSETEYVGKSLTRIKSVALAKSVHIFLVAHPTKLQKIQDKEGCYKYPVATAYDVAGSANFRNKSDNILSIYREGNENNIQVHVQKIRFKDNGKLGMIELSYNPVNGRLSEI